MTATATHIDEHTEADIAAAIPCFHSGCDQTAVNIIWLTLDDWTGNRLFACCRCTELVEQHIAWCEIHVGCELHVEPINRRAW